MLPYERRVASFWAGLANVTDLDTLSEDARQRLREEYTVLGFALGHAFVQSDAVTNTVKQRQFAALLAKTKTRRLPQQDPAVLDKDLASLYRIAQKVVVPVAHKQPATLPKLQSATHQVRVTAENQVAVGLTSGSGVDMLTNELLSLLLTGKTSPFHLCPQCGDVFVPTGPQRFCTERCGMRAWTVANKDTRGPYMKEYMREYQRQKRRAAKQSAAA